MPSLFDYAYIRPDRPGAAEPCEPRQGREAATVSWCLWAPPVSCPDIFFTVHNHAAVVNILLVLLLGIALGLLVGWVLVPIQYVDTTPDTLRGDYRADYVLMVAESLSKRSGCKPGRPPTGDAWRSIPGRAVGAGA